MNLAIRSRLEKVRLALRAQEAGYLLVPASADFRWLTGAVARSTERLVALVLPSEGEPFCVVPSLEAEALEHECPWLTQVVWADHQDALALLVERLALDRRPTLMIGEGFRVAPLLALAARTPCRPAVPLLAPLRAVKDPDEIRHMEDAGRHADQVVMEAADFMRPGMSELEVARFAMQRFEALGDREPWTIVASGPNSALPHHFTSERRLQEGDVVILDVGAYTEGYGSDITRTFWLGGPPDEAERVYAVVSEAQRAAVAAARPGVSCESVDRAARGVIERAGYGEYFIHRTGHGVGLEIHEPPYLVSGSREPLAAGNTHSVEPGIYLPGRFGVRIEDTIVVEANGARSFNRAPIEPVPQRVSG